MGVLVGVFIFNKCEMKVIFCCRVNELKDFFVNMETIAMSISETMY